MINKLKASRFFKLFLVIFLFLGSIVAMVFGSINLGANNSQKGYFGETYSTYFDVDVSSKSTIQEQENAIKDSAAAFSNWLLLKNISHLSVQYELVESSPSVLANNYGRIYAELQNISPVKYRDKDHNQNPIWVLLNSLNTSRITIQQYKPTNTNDNFGDKTTSKYSSILTQEDLLNSSARKDERTEKNSFGVLLDLNGKVLDISSFNDEKALETAPTEFTQWFVFQNLDILIEKLNYAKRLAYEVNNINSSSSTITPEQAENIIFRFETLPSDLQEWANLAVASNNTDIVDEKTILKFYIESKSGSTSSSTNANEKLTALVEPYLLTKNESNKSIDFNNYNNWFPTATVIESSSSSTFSSDSLASTKLMSSRIGTPEVSRISIQTSSETAQKDFIYEMKNTVIKAPLKFSSSSSIVDYSIFGGSLILKPYLDNGMFGLTAYQMTFISFSVLLLIIAIVVCVLYRVPGLFAVFSIFTGVIFSASFLVLLNINFSIPSFIALFFGLIISVSSITLVMERMRKTLKEQKSVFDSIRSTLRKSILTIVDLHIFALIFGLMFVILGKTDVIDIGLTFILFSLVSLACIGLFFVLPLFTISDLKLMWKINFFIFLAKKERKLNVSFNTIKIFNYVLIPLALVVFVVAISLIFTIGASNSFIYNEGTIVYINTNQTVANQIINSIGKNWINPTYSNGLLMMSSSQIFSRNEVTQLLNPYIADISAYNVTFTSPGSSIDIANATVYAVLAGMGLNAVYYMFRLNVFSILPIFIMTGISALFSVSFVYLTWIFLDAFVIYFVIFMVMLSNLIAIIFISITKTRFVKNSIYEIIDIQKFIENNFNNVLNVFATVLGLSLLGSIIFLALISPLTIWVFAYLAIGSLIVIPTTMFLIAFAYYYAIIIRQRYVKNIFENFGAKLNSNKFHEVDEELVKSINDF